jgi:hypothetical protein
VTTGKRVGRFAALSVIALAQLSFVWGRLPAPFLDTRLHYYWDDAFLSFNARSGNRSASARDQFGITRTAYVRWGEAAGTPGHYTDHPFLIPALFQQAARVTGTTERAVRSFSLFVSFGVAAGLFFLVLGATGDLHASVVAALVLVSLPLFATFQVSAKYEPDGMLLGVFQALALGAFLRRPVLKTRVTYVVVTAMTFLAHWTAALYAACVGVFLLARFLRRRDAVSRSAALATLTGGIAGFGVLFALMAFIQGGIREAWAPLAESFTRRAEGVPFGAWASRQWTYLGANFSWTLLGLALGMSVILVRRSLSDRRPEFGVLPLFIRASAVMGVVWMLLFREGSLVHVHWQYWLALPLAGLVGMFIASLRDHPRARVVAGGALLLLCLHLRGLADATYDEIVRVQLGTPQDIAFLKTLREDRFTRMVFVPLTEDPMNEWFEGPLFEYYTDRPVTIIDPEVTPPKSGEKLLVLAIEERSAALAELEARFKRRITGEKCGPRFCAYDVRDP